jgi:glycosyltransferase involved in cell wall biosynthesis
MNQVDDNFEIVVVDSKSSDGSAERLRSYADEGKIKLIEQKCSRGIGRQVALENASGNHVISGLDMDDIFKPRIRVLLRFYHERVDGRLLAGAGEATMIAPRRLLLKLGGWKDLQFRENWELCRRAAGMDVYKWSIFPLASAINPHQERRHWRTRIKYRYIRYRENLRVGHKQFDDGERVGLGQKIVWSAARFSVLFLPKYRVKHNFTSVDPKYFVDSRDYWPKDDDQEKEKELYQLLLRVPMR